MARTSSTTNGMTTAQAADELGVTRPALAGMVRRGVIDPAPAKTEAGRFVWKARDLNRARKALANARMAAIFA